MGLFERASRLKLRFQWKGLISADDCWDLDRSELNSIYQKLTSDLKECQGDSLLNIRSKKAEIIELKIAIIKHIFNVLTEEANEKENAAINESRNQKIRSIIEAKKDSALQEMGIEELEKLIK